jgi:hypothetical protein
MNPNPPTKSGRRSHFSTELKLSILQPWQAGTPAAECCRSSQSNGLVEPFFGIAGSHEPIEFIYFSKM